MAPKRETVTIPSVEEDVFLDVWFYRPDGPGPYPVVIAGHGMTLVKEAGLAVFGERWASEAGYASLILDYRGFGESGGQPRNLLVLDKQLQDFRSVIEWARDRPDTFRTDKIVVMGSALAGLVVSKLLIHDPALAGGIGHSPVLDGYSTLMSLSPNPRILFWTIADFLSGKIGWSPIFVKAVGEPSQFAFLNTPSCIPGFFSMYEHGTIGKPFSSADNVVAPRVAFEMMSWKTPLQDLKSPLLVVAGDNDDMIPLHVTRCAVDAANGRACLQLFSGGHFDVMEGGKAFEFNMNAQLDFLRSLL